MSIILTSALSGFIGALAGGGIALISQILSRKWQKEDQEHKSKKQLYSEISGIGSDYVGDEVYKRINSNIGKALLMCDRDLVVILLEYAASIEKANIRSDEKNFDKRKEVANNAAIHSRLVDLMRKELGIDN